MAISALKMILVGFHEVCLDIAKALSSHGMNLSQSHPRGHAQKAVPYQDLAMESLSAVSVVSQVGFAFHRIEAALSVLIMKMADFSGLAAQTERLEALLDGTLPLMQHLMTCCRLEDTYMLALHSLLGPFPA